MAGDLSRDALTMDAFRTYDATHRKGCALKALRGWQPCGGLKAGEGCAGVLDLDACLIVPGGLMLRRTAASLRPPPRVGLASVACASHYATPIEILERTRFDHRLGGRF
ncbi:unnamed protein product, partial [Iphiclides podalirius]